MLSKVAEGLDHLQFDERYIKYPNQKNTYCSQIHPSIPFSTRQPKDSTLKRSLFCSNIFLTFTMLWPNQSFSLNNYLRHQDENFERIRHSTL